jgi:uncharacterized membrane protein
MNPFDPKAALLAKHAQHVVLVHFPIALFMTGVLFDLAARWTKEVTRQTTLAAGSRLNILAAAVSVLPTLATGIAAWEWQLGGHKLKGMLLLHVVLGSVSGLLICLVAGMHLRRSRSAGSSLPRYYLPLQVLTVVVVALTAHVGGFVSGINVPG